MGFLPDTNCMIAAVSSWHVFHEAALRELNQRLSSRQQMAVAGPALVEAYSALTRLPPRYRAAPADALALLSRNFVDKSKVVSLDEREYVSLLRSLPPGGIAGGRSFDAVIAACARKAGVAAILTFNPKDFLPFASESLDIVVPE